MFGASFLTSSGSLGRGHRDFRDPDHLEIYDRRAGGQLRDPRRRTEAARQSTAGDSRESRASDAVGEVLRFRLIRAVAAQRRRLGVSRHSRRQRSRTP